MTPGEIRYLRKSIKFLKNLTDDQIKHGMVQKYLEKTFFIIAITNKYNKCYNRICQEVQGIAQ